jgi:hypothetical protein
MVIAILDIMIGVEYRLKKERTNRKAKKENEREKKRNKFISIMIIYSIIKIIEHIHI